MDFIHDGLKILIQLNTSLCLFGLLIVCLSSFWLLKKTKYKLPPGPWCLPILGYLPVLTNDVVVETRKLSEKYGKIVCIYLGPSRLIMLNDYQLVREAFENPALQDRPAKMFDFYPDGLGFGVESGEEWKEQRKFSMKALKNLGLGNSEWQTNLAAEITDFLKVLEEQGGKPYDPQHLVAATVSNFMLGLILGKRFPLGDPSRILIDEGVSAVTRTFADNSAIVMVFPMTMQFLCRLGLTRFAEDYRKMCAFNDFIKKEIESRKKTMDEDDKEIFIDEYIREMERMQKNNMHSYFTDFNLGGVVRSLVIGGSDTSRIFLMWTIIAMAAFPEVQKKVHEEIDANLGRDGVITWIQRNKLPYTHATLLESLRWKPPGPIGILHCASEDTQIAGYDIPKNTSIAPNIALLHYDEKVWKDSGSFKPERFLDEDGNVIINRHDNYLPFSYGKRVCPGEQTASIQLFLFIVYILQKFDILTPSEDMHPDLTGLRTGVLNPKSQKLRFVLRD